ncbi:hypothetical protein SUGI_1031220 [Cryptomeria japonica]|nr:hypothetical protein SUGI_1031220 [Cryptomeria japonica]
MGHFCVCYPLVLRTKLAFGNVRRAPLYFNLNVIKNPAVSICTGISAYKKLETNNASNNLQLFDSLNTEQKCQVSLFVDTLLEWNQRMNLTAVTERCAVMERHVEDSLTLLPIIENAYSKHCSAIETPKFKVVDVGSGAGLPGVILAIARPDWQVTLIEPRQKRCCFMENFVELSSISNIQIVRIRAEDAGQNPEFREMYDVAVARAVAEMRVLAEYCLPLIRVGGLFVAAKGYEPQEEVKNAKKAIGLLGAFILQLCSVASEGPYGQRTAVLCLKDRPTPAKHTKKIWNSDTFFNFLRKTSENLYYDKVTCQDELE